MTDKNVEAVRDKLKQRAERGLSKYGVTTERTDLSMKDWIIHAQEEAMDLAVYLERIKSDMNCPDCGKPNAGDLHTCSPQANRLETMIFVYRHKITGHINALYHEDALYAAKRDDLEHLATLEPRLFIQAHYAKVSGAADPVLPSAGETTGPVSAAPTLREAAQQALEIFDLGILREEQHRRVEALRAALAEPVVNQQLTTEPVQPVAWQINDGKYVYVTDRLVDADEATAERWTCTPLYTASPQRKPLELNRIVDCARRLVENADFRLSGALSKHSKAKDIPSKAISYVKARNLAALRDALAEHGITGGSDE